MGRMVASFFKTTLMCGLALSVFACGNKTVMDAYLLKEPQLAGDPGKGVKPVKNIIIWPLNNSATGGKAKGIETKITDLFVDKFYLENIFDSVVIVTPDRASDLLTRAGEELGLKRKPKDIDSGLVATKVGQLAGGEAIFLGTINDFDEDKTDKATESLVSGVFYLADAREKAYPALDSFTPVKYLWRTNIKQTSAETLFWPRASLDRTAREMVNSVVQNMVDDFSGSQQDERGAIERKLRDMKRTAEENTNKGEFDKSIAGWNEILKLDPGNAEAKARIEDNNARKKAAEEKKKADALKKEIDGIKKEAADLEKSGKIDEAVAKWQSVLDKDKADKEAAAKVEKLKARIAEERERARQQDISKQLYLAQKSFDDKKYQEAIDAAKKVLETDKENEKAKAIIKDATAKLDEMKAQEKKASEAKAAQEKPAEKPQEAAPAPQEVKEVPVKVPEEAAPAPAEPEKAKIQAPAQGAKSPEIEGIRKSAMDYFDKEDYQKSHDEWVKLLQRDPNDAQAKEMLDTTQMLMKALQ